MMKRILSISLAILFATGAVLMAVEEQPQEIEGIWQGVLNFSGIELRIIFKISKKPDGSLAATLDSPDQGATDIPINKVTLENSRLKLEATTIGGVFEGTVKEDGSEIKGEWKQGGISLPLVLKRIDKAPEVRRPQEPKKPYPYLEEEVAYENKKAGIKLAGTLTLPRFEGPFPAVLLITGSGPQDRNETVFGHRPFLVLADYLTRRNIAVLRVDDRGVGGSTGHDTQPTTMDLAEDVLAGIEFLKTRCKIDPRRIGLIGHSEGGLIAPIVATQSPDVAFIVMMAGTGLKGEDILSMQAALIARAEGKSEEEVSKLIESQKAIFEVVKTEKDNAVAEAKIMELFKKSLADMSEKDKKEMGNNPEDYFKLQTKTVLSAWFRFFLTFDPRIVLDKVKCPVLAISGEKDLQVPPRENLEAIEKALKAGGNKNYTIKILPGLNHLFQTAQTGSPTEYSKIEETISPAALNIIGDWILSIIGEQEEKKD